MYWLLKQNLVKARPRIPPITPVTIIDNVTPVLLLFNKLSGGLIIHWQKYDDSLKGSSLGADRLPFISFISPPQAGNY